MSANRYVVRELRHGYFVIDVVKHDGSSHLIGGFKNSDEAEAWVRKWEAAHPSQHRQLPDHFA